jgi:hypothetical protein
MTDKKILILWCFLGNILFLVAVNFMVIQDRTEEI